MNVGQLIPLVKGHQAIYDACRCEHRNRDYIASVWVQVAQDMDNIFRIPVS